MKTHSTVILVTGLFNETDTVTTALAKPDDANTSNIILAPDQMGEKDWDGVVTELLSATKVITI